MFRRRVRGHSDAGPWGWMRRILREVDGLNIFICLIALVVICALASFFIWPPYHKDPTKAKTEIPTELQAKVEELKNPPTTPAPPYLAVSEWLVSYQGRDLRCLAIHGDVEGERMTCDWVRYWAEGGPSGAK